MTFDELLDKACAVAQLPEMARIQLPNTLSSDTKKKLRGQSPEIIGRILTEAIDAVNHGSIESIDTLVKKEIKKMRSH